jgi:hypothetical protein
MQFFAVRLYISSVYSNKAACFALYTVQQRPKFLN